MYDSAEYAYDNTGNIREVRVSTGPAPTILRSAASKRRPLEI